jgi:tryptophanyl-tRNA synthetase
MLKLNNLMIDKKVSIYSDQLKQLGITHSILEHPELKEVEDVQKHLGFSLTDAGAMIIMKAGDAFVAVMRRGDCKLDFKKIKKILKVSNLRVATNEEFIEITQVPPGAAHVLYPNLRTLIDKKIFETEYINAGSGSLLYTFRYKTSDLKKLPTAEVVDISEQSIIEHSHIKTNTIKRVFSGIRATGRLHLGNYLGAVKGMLEIQNSGEYETVFCVVDVHTITTPYKVEELRKNKREIIIDYLAAGLDPKKSMIIYQSDVPQHTELAFYFSSIMTIARMQHLPTFKDKVKQHPQHNTMALLNYPILMAADILIYKAGLVPVGIDQEPHLEIAREVARKMNEQYGMDFPEPVRFATKGEYIPSLKGEGKMSKSVEGSYINLTDSKDEINKKIRSIPTATTPGGEMSNGVKTLFTYAKLYIPNLVATYEEQFKNGSLKFVELKDAIASAIYEDLKPMQEKRKQLEANPEYVDTVIRESAEKARSIAQQTVDEVKKKMGLG